MALIFGVRSNLLSHPDPVPIGSVMVFHQDAAPDGWVKDVNAALDNAALRIVTSTDWASGRAGASSFSSVFATAKKTANFTLLEEHMPSHNHNVGGTVTAESGAATRIPGSTAVASDPTGGDQGHQHDLVLDLHHVNFIICTKE